MKTEKKTYSREALLNSKRFAYVQKDFLKAILTSEYYTIEEAEEAIKKVLRGVE